MNEILGVTGSRNFNEDMILRGLDYINYNNDIEKIVSGGAEGTDRCVENWCDGRDIEYIEIRPLHNKRNWYLYRNVELVTMSDLLVAFWDKKSTGTPFTFSYAIDRGKEVIVIDEEGNLAYYNNKKLCNKTKKFFNF